MFKLPTLNNPVGEVFKNAELDAFIEKLKSAWDEVKPKLSTAAALFGNIDFAPVFNFILRSTEELVMYMVQHDIPGPDKKATVLAAVGTLYDYAISGMLPIYLRPFAGAIRHTVVDVIASGLIDWLCEKLAKVIPATPAQ